MGFFLMVICLSNCRLDSNCVATTQYSKILEQAGIDAKVFIVGCNLKKEISFENSIKSDVEGISDSFVNLSVMIKDMVSAMEDPITPGEYDEREWSGFKEKTMILIKGLSQLFTDQEKKRIK